MKGGRIKNTLRVMVRGVMAHYGLVLLAGFVLTGLSAYIIITSFDIRSDLKDLMPENSESAMAMETISGRLGSITNLSIFVETRDRKLSPEARESPAYKACLERNEATREEADKTDCEDVTIIFAHALATRLEQLEQVGYVHFHNDKRFFKDNLLLYASVEELEDLYDDVDEELNDARRKTGEYKACLVTALDTEDCEDLKPGEKKKRAPDAKSGLEDEQTDNKQDDYLERYSGRLDTSEINFEGEYFQYTLPDGAWALKLLIRFRDPLTSMARTQEQLELIKALVNELEPTSFNPDLTVVYGGGFVSRNEDYESVINDVIFSASMTFGSIFLLMVLFFRRLRAVLVIMTPLVMSIGWTLGLAFATVGYLNLVTAFIFAVLLGLGIDFGIHILARYDEERSGGRDVLEAMEISVVEVGSANLSGALTTSATFLSLMLADFRGFSQFGLVAGVGVLLSLLAMLVILPAMVLLAHRIWAVKARKARGHHVGSSAKRRWVRIAVPLTLVALCSSAALSLWNLDNVQFEEDFYRLQMRKDEKAKEKMSRYGSTSKRHSSPAVILLDSLEEVSAIEQVVRNRLGDGGTRLLRRFVSRFPNAMIFFNQRFGSAFAMSVTFKAAPSVTLMTSVMPEVMHWYIPKQSRFDPEGSEDLALVSAFVEAYPGWSDRLSRELLAKPLSQHPVFALIATSGTLRRWLPAPLQSSLPTRFDKQQLETIDHFVSVFSFVPGTESEQREKLEIIAKIKKRTNARRIRFLLQEDRKKINDLRRFLVEKPVTVDDLPPWVKQQFKEGGTAPIAPREGSGVDYAFGNVAFLYQNTGSSDGMSSRRLANEVRSLNIRGKTVTASSNSIVFSDMLEQIKNDGQTLVSVVFIVVFLVILLQARSLLRAIVIMAPLIFGLCLVVGLMVVFNLRITFFNMVVIPMLIGMGIDDGVHLYHRYAAEGRGSILYAMRHTGGSIFMTSATTGIGFSGMIFSRHMGINTMGELAVLGIFCIWLATMLVQPALIVVAEWIGLKAIVPEKVFEP